MGSTPVCLVAGQLIEINQIIFQAHFPPNQFGRPGFDSLPGPRTKLAFVLNLFLLQGASTITTFEGDGGENQPLLDGARVLLPHSALAFRRSRPLCCRNSQPTFLRRGLLGGNLLLLVPAFELRVGGCLPNPDIAIQASSYNPAAV